MWLDTGITHMLDDGTRGAPVQPESVHYLTPPPPMFAPLAVQAAPARLWCAASSKQTSTQHNALAVHSNALPVALGAPLTLPQYLSTSTFHVLEHLMHLLKLAGVWQCFVLAKDKGCQVRPQVASTHAHDSCSPFDASVSTTTTTTPHPEHTHHNQQQQYTWHVSLSAHESWA